MRFDARHIGSGLWITNTFLGSGCVTDSPDSIPRVVTQQCCLVKRAIPNGNCAYLLTPWWIRLGGRPLPSRTGRWLPSVGPLASTAGARPALTSVASSCAHTMTSDQQGRSRHSSDRFPWTRTGSASGARTAGCCRGEFRTVVTAFSVQSGRLQVRELACRACRSRTSDSSCQGCARR
jgi:hypothetical protein